MVLQQRLNQGLMSNQQFMSNQLIQIITIQMDKKTNSRFYLKYKQKADMNQYWYSPATIEFLVNQAVGTERVCFMSTPSIFFSVPESQTKKGWVVFDFDEKFGEKNPNYLKYDFKSPQNIPEQYKNYFDMVIVDPPFITEEVWKLYTTAIKYVLKEGGKILVSSIDENEKMLKQLINVDKLCFRPSIPHLVYQYSFYANYKDPSFEQVNPEIGF